MGDLPSTRLRRPWEVFGPGLSLVWRKCNENILVKRLDKVVFPLYNTHMTATKAPRKKRTDRNHIIYELNVGGLTYVGVTAKTESTALKSARTRANKHFYRAMKDGKNWLLCEALRGLDSKEEIGVRVLAVVRGKAPAHKEEVRIRRELQPALNTDCRGD